MESFIFNFTNLVLILVILLISVVILGSLGVVFGYLWILLFKVNVFLLQTLLHTVR